jgi:apolipoprotein D and lipocalin family protein
MKNLLIFSLFSILLTTSNCQTKLKMTDSKTVEKVELQKFLGTWYEIARFNHSFEKGLVGVTATYSLRKDGKIKVLNKGYKNSLNGKLSIAEGKAKIPDANVPGKFKVAFFWFFYADYNILELDSENYQWALIGSSSDTYLWILCRTPQMDDNIYQMLIDKAKARGYKTENLIKVLQ